MICHGNGNLDSDGCCYVDGQVCPLRWKVVNGNVFDAAGVDLGTIADIAATYTKNKSAQQKIVNQVSGTTFLCKAAVDVLAKDPSLLNNRAGFEDAWNNHPDYLAKVRPAWVKIEQKLNMPAGTYQCSRWRGVDTMPQCCFAETQAENDAKAANLTTDAKTIRGAAK